MKKVLALLLAINALLATAGCGNNKTDGTVSTTPETVTEQQAEAPKKVEAEPVAVGNQITVDFAEITINEAAIADDIKQSIKSGNITYTTGPNPSADTEFVYIRGTLKNTSTSSINNPQIVGTVKFGEYSYDLKGLDIIESDGSSAYEIAPLIDYTYTLYAEVPNALLESNPTCTMNFAFNESFDYQNASSEEMGKMPYNYSISIGQ